VLVFAVSFYIVGALLLAAGIAVYKGKTAIIQNYHRKNVTDNKNYGIAMGKAISAMGLSAFVTATLSFLGDAFLMVGTVLFLVVMVVMMVIVYFIQKKYNGSMFSF